VSVTYAPTSGTTEPNAVDIKVETSPGKFESFTVNLKGSSQPQLCAIPEGILMFKVAPSQSETQQVTIVNCGYADLVVDKIEIDQTSGTPQSFALQGLPPFSKTVAAGDSFQFDVQFTNNPMISVDSAMLNITSNDPYYNPSEPDHPFYIISLVSDDNTTDMPPAAVCSSPGGDVQQATEAELATGFTVNLDGSKSTDTDATGIASYEWKLIAKPTKPKQSNATIQNATSVSASFGADVFGKYTVQLTATDTIGQVSAPSVCTITVIKAL
jgi:hypothetical protein